MNTKNNQRSKDTETKIESVFLNLLSEKHISKITVMEICEKAGITRTSFYGHYKDIYDLLQKVESSITDRLLQIFRTELEQSHKDLRVAFIRIFRFISENKEFFKYFFQNSDIRTLVSFGTIYGSPKTVSRQAELRRIFFIGGLNSTLIQWLETDCRDLPEEILDSLPLAYIEEI